MSLLARIPAAQDGLKALVAQALAATVNQSTTALFTAGDIHVGYPVGGPAFPDGVWIHGLVTDRKSVDLTTGAGLREKEDTFTLHVRFAVIRGSTEYAVVRDALLGYMGLVEDALPGNRTLGGAVVDSTVVGGGIEEFTTNGDVGRGMQGEVLVECLALT